MGIKQVPKVLCKRLSQEWRDGVADMSLLVGLIPAEDVRVCPYASLAEEFAAKNVQRQCVFKFARAKNLRRAHAAKATTSPRRGLCNVKSARPHFLVQFRNSPLAGGTRLSAATAAVRREWG